MGTPQNSAMNQIMAPYVMVLKFLNITEEDCQREFGCSMSDMTHSKLQDRTDAMMYDRDSSKYFDVTTTEDNIKTLSIARCGIKGYNFCILSHYPTTVRFVNEEDAVKFKLTYP